MVLKRAADLAEALYSMPPAPRAAGHHFALSSPGGAAAAAAAAGSVASQLTLAPTSPVSIATSSSPAVSAAPAGFNGYPAEYHQQNFGWDDSWTHRY